MDLSQWEWTCGCCGRKRTGVPDFGFDAPIHYHWAETGDGEFRVLSKDSDTCTMEIAGERCSFVRGVLALPILGTAERFGFGAWSSLGAGSFRRYSESFSDPGQGRIGSMFGYLANRPPDYPDTLNLRLDVMPQNGGRRPELRVRSEHADHPLFRDQVDGLTPARLAAMLSRLMPCDGRA